MIRTRTSTFIILEEHEWHSFPALLLCYQWSASDLSIPSRRRVYWLVSNLLQPNDVCSGRQASRQTFRTISTKRPSIRSLARSLQRKRKAASQACCCRSELMRKLHGIWIIYEWLNSELLDARTAAQMDIHEILSVRRSFLRLEWSFSLRLVFSKSSRCFLLLATRRTIDHQDQRRPLIYYLQVAIDKLIDLFAVFSFRLLGDWSGAAKCGESYFDTSRKQRAVLFSLAPRKKQSEPTHAWLS